MKNTIKDWTCTDPDNHQYGRKVSDGIYEFKEFDRFNNGIPDDPDEYKNTDTFIECIWDDDAYWIEIAIVLSHYTEEEIENHISAYYNNVAQVKEIYGDDAEWIIAECIFEQESGQY